MPIKGNSHLITAYIIRVVYLMKTKIFHIEFKKKNFIVDHLHLVIDRNL